MVGGSDALTGVALVARPTLVLSVLGLDAPVEPVYLRFIGVFVCSVGFAYLYPFALSDRLGRSGRLRAVLEWTAGVRLAVALFVTLSVAGRALAPAWLVISGFDAGVALSQLALLSRGRLADAR